MSEYTRESEPVNIRKGSFEIVFPGDVEHVSESDVGRVLGSTLARLKDNMGLSDEEFNERLFEETIDEALVNALKHGNRYDARKKVIVAYEVSPDRITISVTDEGQGFTLEEVPDPTADKNLLKPSGRGVRSYMQFAFDEITTSKTERGFILTLTKRRKKAQIDKISNSV